MEVGIARRKLAKKRELAMREIRWAIHATSTGTIRHVDEDMKTIKVICEHSRVYEMSLDRSKCAEVIRCVAGKYFAEIFREELADKKVSLVVDEINDISSSIKLFGVVVRYPDYSKGKIKSAFMGIHEINAETEAGLYEGKYYECFIHL